MILRLAFLLLALMLVGCVQAGGGETSIPYTNPARACLKECETEGLREAESEEVSSKGFTGKNEFFRKYVALCTAQCCADVAEKL